VKNNTDYTPQPGPKSGDINLGKDHQGGFHHTHAYDDAEMIPGIKDLHDDAYCVGTQTKGFHKGR
jgi:hypothetical protein